MKHCLVLLLVLFGVSLARADSPTLNVWPSKPPGETAQIPAEEWSHSKPGEPTWKKVVNVSEPTLTVYRPSKEADTGVAVLVCPGGGYRMLMMDYEGEDVAHWLNTLGITGVVLKYRVPGRAGQPNYLAALQD